MCEWVASGHTSVQRHSDQLAAKLRSVNDYIEQIVSHDPIFGEEATRTRLYALLSGGRPMHTFAVEGVSAVCAHSRAQLHITTARYGAVAFGNRRLSRTGVARARATRACRCVLIASN